MTPEDDSKGKKNKHAKERVVEELNLTNPALEAEDVDPDHSVPDVNASIHAGEPLNPTTVALGSGSVPTYAGIPTMPGGSGADVKGVENLRSGLEAITGGKKVLNGIQAATAKGAAAISIAKEAGKRLDAEAAKAEAKIASAARRTPDETREIDVHATAPGYFAEETYTLGSVNLDAKPVEWTATVEKPVIPDLGSHNPGSAPKPAPEPAKPDTTPSLTDLVNNATLPGPVGAVATPIPGDAIPIPNSARHSDMFPDEKTPSERSLPPPIPLINKRKGDFAAGSTVTSNPGTSSVPPSIPPAPKEPTKFGAGNGGSGDNGSFPPPPALRSRGILKKAVYFTGALVFAGACVLGIAAYGRHGGDEAADHVCKVMAGNPSYSTDENRRLAKRNAKLLETLETSNTRVEECRGALTKSKGIAKQLKTRAEDAEEDVVKLNKTVALLKRRTKSLDADLTAALAVTPSSGDGSCGDELTDARSKISGYRREVADLTARLGEANTSVASLQKAAREYDLNLARETKRAKAAEKKLAALAGLDKRAESAEKQVKALEERVRGYDARIKGHTAKVTELNNTIAGLRTDASKAQEKITAYEAQVAGLQKSCKVAPETVVAQSTETNTPGKATDAPTVTKAPGKARTKGKRTVRRRVGSAPAYTPQHRLADLRDAYVKAARPGRGKLYNQAGLTPIEPSKRRSAPGLLYNR